MPVLSKRIILDCFYLLIFYFEKFSTDVCRLPCAVNVNLNLSNVSHSTHSNCHCLNFDKFRDTAPLANVLTPKSGQN